MKFIDIARKRYSVRSYSPQPIEEDKLMKILEAGRVAPTGCNNQPQRIIAVQSQQGLEKVNKATNTFGAPVVLIICGDKDFVWKRSYDGKDILDIDLSIVTDHMMLQATELGIGSLWKCAFKPDIIVEEFNLPKNIVPVNVLLLGYADGEILSPDRHKELRKSLKDTVFFENL